MTKARPSVIRAAVLAVALCLSVIATGSGSAQGIMPGTGSTDAAPAQPAAPTDPLGRQVPQGLVTGLLRAMADEDYVRAARYLDLRDIPQQRRAYRGPVLAHQLQQILDKGGWVDANWQLSTDPQGLMDDNLPPDRESFATVRTPEGPVTLIAQRVENPESGPVWLVSAETVALLPDLLARMETGLIDRLLPQQLTDGLRLGGVPIGHWLALVALAVVAYLVAWVVTSLAIAVVHRVWRRSRGPGPGRILAAAIVPLRIFLAVWLFAVGAIFIGASVIARQQFAYVAAIVAWIAIAWFLWRVVDAVGEISMERLSRTTRYGALSAIRFFRRSIKVVIVALAAIAALDTIGFDVTAGLAALGIGGIAIALGAQKTIENFIGSLTLIADQPIRVGDYCKFGDTSGTVEDIGMRSTRIRTLDRTVVTVPNGEFASLQIENYTARDRYWFHPVLGLRYETTPDQIRYLLVELRSLLYAHPRIDPDSARVRFLGIGADSLNIDIFAYAIARDYTDFLGVQEDLTLRIMDIVAESGAGFAFSSRTLYMARDSMPPDDKRQAAESRVREWTERGELQVPDFDPERAAALRGTIDYPPKGSGSYTGDATTPGSGSASTRR